MNWPDYLMGFAVHAAKKSKDSTKVGAALVGPDRDVRLCAFNGPPKGVRDLPERFERENGVKYRFASHAEQNLIAFAAREGIRTKDCSVFVTHMPCSSCARSLIQAGVSKVVVGTGTTSMPADEFEAAETMFREADVQVVRLDVPETEFGNISRSPQLATDHFVEADNMVEPEPEEDDDGQPDEAQEWRDFDPDC